MKTAGRVLIGAALLLAAVLVHPETVSARPEFAQFTGNPCSACHISAQGGGPLTAEGEKFKRSLRDLDVPLAPELRISRGRRLLHFVLYLFHIPFGVAWVGLFLYSFGSALRRHTAEPPPRTYTRQMVYGMVVALATGPMLAATRMRMVPDLFDTRFGILLLVKIVLVLLLLMTTVALLWHLTVVLSRRYRRLAKRLGTGSDMDLAPEDLLLFNGRDKRKALVAVDGRVYEVTGRDLWRRGIHPGGHRAGYDLTGDLAGAPHGREVFERIRPVGRVSAPAASGRNRFYTWAVRLGTGASVLILLVVALWRW